MPRPLCAGALLATGLPGAPRRGRLPHGWWVRAWAGSLAVGLLLVLLGPFMAIDQAQAAPLTLYSSLDDGAWRESAGVLLGQSFTTGPDAVELESVGIRFRTANESNTSATASTYSVTVWSSSSGTPAAVVGTVAVGQSASPWSDGVATFALTTPITLEASTDYFVVVAADAGGTFGWKYNANPVTTSVSPAPTFTSLRSTDGGTTWTATTDHYGMELVASTAPATTTSPSSSTTSTTSSSTTTAPTTSSTTSSSTTTAPTTSTSTTTAPTTSTSTTSTSTTSTSTTSTSTTSSSTTSTSTTSTTVATVPPTTAPPPSTTIPGTPTTPPRPTPTPGPSLTGTVPPRTTGSSGPTTTNPGAPTASSTGPPPSGPTAAPPGPSATVPAPAPAEAGPPPRATPPSPSPFADREGEQVKVRVQVEPGQRAAGAPVAVSAVALPPGAPLTVTVHSEPQVVLRATASPDGTFDGTAPLPEGLEPGTHTVIVHAVGSSADLDVVGAFTLDDEGRVGTIAQPALLEGFQGPGDPRLERALAFGKPAYDVAAHPLTTAGVAVTAAAGLALAGAAGLSGAQLVPAGGERRRRSSRGKLASPVTKKLKGIQIESTARGDLSGTWAVPGTAKIDALGRTLPLRLGRWSSLLPRILVDGSWLRAMFGSAALVLWLLAAALGVTAGKVDATSPLAPALPILLALVVLGILDASAGAVGWLTIAVLALAHGDVTTAADVRTLMGLGVLLASVPLLAHVIRPLRRYVAERTSERWERVFDYVMMPVMLAFAAGSMFKALNGLSGLELVASDDVTTVRWVVALAIVARLAGEDVATHLYPERSAAVQPAKLVSPGRLASGVAIVVRSLVFLFIAEPFFGVGPTTLLAALLLALPMVGKLWEDDLPNSATLHRWLPRGLLRFFLMLVLGAYLTAALVGGRTGDDVVRSTFVWLLLPGVVVGVIELFGRHGGDWPESPAKRALGAIVWVGAVSIVTGQLVLFA